MDENKQILLSDLIENLRAELQKAAEKGAGQALLISA